MNQILVHHRRFAEALKMVTTSSTSCGSTSTFGVIEVMPSLTSDGVFGITRMTLRWPSTVASESSVTLRQSTPPAHLSSAGRPDPEHFENHVGFHRAKQNVHFTCQTLDAFRRRHAILLRHRGWCRVSIVHPDIGPICRCSPAADDGFRHIAAADKPDFLLQHRFILNVVRFSSGLAYVSGGE